MSVFLSGYFLVFGTCYVIDPHDMPTIFLQFFNSHFIFKLLMQTNNVALWSTHLYESINTMILSCTSWISENKAHTDLAFGLRGGRYFRSFYKF